MLLNLEIHNKLSLNTYKLNNVNIITIKNLVNRLHMLLIGKIKKSLWEIIYKNLNYS